MNFNLNDRSIDALSKVFSDSLVGREINNILQECNIEIIDGSSKAKKLYSSFINYKNKYNSSNSIMNFITSVLKAVNYLFDEDNKYTELLEKVNKILITEGFQIDENNNIVEVEKVLNLNEIEKRVNSIRKKLKDRKIHSEVLKYCKEDYLRKDYYDTVFEASKSLGERVRDLSGLNTDGTELFQTAFSRKNPLIVLNQLNTESEINEYNGLKELLLSICHLVRNPTAHTPKINWKMNEDEAIDILSIISFAHNYLDKCYQMPKYKND